MVGIISQKRNPKRMPTFLQGQLQGADLTQRVCVRDVSVNGALLEASQPLEVFEIVTLICGTTKVNGIVAWCDKGLLGMEFSELLTCKVLVDTLKSRLRVTAPKKYQSEI